MSERGSTAVNSQHGHQCARCDYEWNCLQPKCQVAHAAKVNKGGPFCDLCMHIVMAKRYAAKRKITTPGFMALLGSIADLE